MKIRIYPTKRQRRIFENYFGITRYIYNKSVEYYKKREGPISRQSMRSSVMGPDEDLSEDMKWLTKLPYDSRQFSIDNFISGYRSALENKRKGNIASFDFSYKSKKMPTQRFYINKKAIDMDLKLFKRRHAGKCKITQKDKKRIKNNISKIESNCLIVRDRNRYFICIPNKKKIREIENREKFISLDPGERTFQTFYGEKSYGKIGDNFKHKLDPKMKKIDKLIGTIEKETRSAERYKLRKKILSLRTKMKNKVTNLHWQTASFLVKNYEIIVLPRYETSKMISKNRSKLHKITKRRMLTLSHYSFLEKLKYLTKTVKSTKLIICTEEYTTKTCGNCGKINDYIEGSRIFECGICNVKIDRDINGARNILIKKLTEINDLPRK